MTPFQSDVGAQNLRMLHQMGKFVVKLFSTMKEASR
jgi:hypothetical protein